MGRVAMPQRPAWASPANSCAVLELSRSSELILQISNQHCEQISVKESSKSGKECLHQLLGMAVYTNHSNLT